MMTFPIERMNEGVRAALVAHFHALPMKDRFLRFGRSLAPARYHRALGALLNVRFS